jgi:hypothetical protein
VAFDFGGQPLRIDRATGDAGLVAVGGEMRLQSSVLRLKSVR